MRRRLRLVEPDERGDPMSPLRWTTKSLRNLAEELTRQGPPVSAPTVGRLLKRQGFSLQASAKTLEGKQHPDRDAQFRYINEQVKEHQSGGQPVISIDAWPALSAPGPNAAPPTQAHRSHIASIRLLASATGAVEDDETLRLRPVPS